MSYILSQKYYPGEEVNISSPEYETNFLKLNTDFTDIVLNRQEETKKEENYIFDVIGEGKGENAKAKYVGRKETISDYQVTAIDNSFKFYDDYLILNNSFKVGKAYYFHGKIKRMKNSSQIFYIKLKHSERGSGTGTEEFQYIKTITVRNGDATEWVDVEFIFSPLKEFDSLVFELQRESRDYREETRFAIIAYLEVSEIIDYYSFNKIKAKKIGVQSHPGLLMCINEEEIRIGRTGIYELKDGVLTTEFFAVVHSAEEQSESNASSSIFEQWKKAVNKRIEEIELEQSQNPNEKNCYVSDENGDYYKTTDQNRREFIVYKIPNKVETPSLSDLSNYYEQMISEDERIFYRQTEDESIDPSKTYYLMNDAVFISDEDAQYKKEAVHSVVFCKTNKKRVTSKFVLDYMY